MDIKNYIVTPLQMKKLENENEYYDITESQLMQNAGTALAKEIMKISTNSNIVILAGNGNNGGDGFVAYSLLRKKGYNVRVILTMGDPKTDLAKDAFEKINLKHINYLDKISKDETFLNCSVVVDCIMGIGFSGELSKELLSLFNYVNALECKKVACDIPTGLSALNGYCNPEIIKCDYTVTFGAIKIGTLLYPGKDYCGQIIPIDIGIPENIYSNITNKIISIDDDFVKENLKKRTPDSYKGSYGKVTVLSGSRNYPGAAALCTSAALRCGVGICELASTDYVCETVVSKFSEVIFLPLMESQQGHISSLNKDFILENCKNSDCVVIGCGIGYTPDIANLVIQLVENLKCPVVIDADGINAISTSLLTLKNRTAPTVITPHIGELAAISKLTIQQVIESRVQLAMAAERELNATIVSKGAGTFICSNGSTKVTYLSQLGNAGLAKGGSGDILAGMIGSFIAQGIDQNIASAIAVYLHGKAAERLSEKLSMHGMLPSDIVKELAVLLKEYE